MRDVFPEGPLVVWQEPKATSTLIAAHEMVARTAEHCSSSTTYRFCQEDISAVIAASVDHHAVFSPDLQKRYQRHRWRDQSVPLCFGEDSLPSAGVAETGGGSCVPAVWRCR